MTTSATILGQEQALEILRTALASERFHHAWIFSGPRGVGKFTTALDLARILLDPEADSAQLGLARSITSTHVQSLMTAGTHPDLHIIQKEMALYSDDKKLREKKLYNIPLDLIRERMIGGYVGNVNHEAAAYRTPQLNHGKVFIIDEAELLAEEGQNSMLKTLEEPPPNTYFFLITNQIERLYPTIRSRCQHVRFARLDRDSMQQWLKRQAANAKNRQPDLESTEISPDAWKLPPDTLAWLEHFADGSPGAATLAAEYGFYNWQMQLNPMLAQLDAGRYPPAMGETLAKWADDFAVAWVKNHKNASKDAANKDGTRQVFALLSSHLREVLAKQVQRGEDAENTMAAIDVIHDAERQLERHVSMKLVMDNLVVQWSQSAAGMTVGAAV